MWLIFVAWFAFLNFISFWEFHAWVHCSFIITSLPLFQVPSPSLSQIQVLSYLLSSINAAHVCIGLTFGHRNHQRACSWKKKKPLLFFAVIGCLYYSTRDGVWWALPLFVQDHWLVWSSVLSGRHCFSADPVSSGSYSPSGPSLLVFSELWV